MADEWLIDVRRVYDPPDADDGHRALVDRIWPRGLTKHAAAIDEWCRDIAPSTELRRWYDHDPDRFPIFRNRYLSELDDRDHAEALAHLQALTDARLTLLTATRDLGISHARVLAERLSWGRARHGPTVTRVHLDLQQSRTATSWTRAAGQERRP
jgi:uncharacterized protein YeaO (DUF488 family)